MKRTFLTLALLAGLTSLIFMACNDKEERVQQMQQKSDIKGNKIPDGTYVGYYNFDNAKKIEVKQMVRDNEVVKRWVNGEETDLNKAPIIKGRFWKKGDNKYAEDKAVDMALELSKTYPCVSILTFPSLEDEEVIIYQVNVEKDVPCEYEKYQ